MPLNNRVAELETEVTQWRRHLHTIPELCFKEVKTSAYVAEKLSEFGIDEIHTGIAKTGVVGVIKSGTSKRAIGLRADMDGLPMDEEANVPYKSTHDGRMHGCGHDGHTSMLLGAAKYLSETRNFDGTVYLYFQPAEEGDGGASVMIQEGLFEKFRPDEIYAMHNKPNLEVGKFAVSEGPVMGQANGFWVTIHGKGGHASQPHNCIDPIFIGAEMIMAWQSLVSRYTNPLDPIVLTTTQFHGGSAMNVIPNSALLTGTIRLLNPDLSVPLSEELKKISEKIADANRATIDFKFQFGCPPVVNETTTTARARAVCEKIVGTDQVVQAVPSLGGEDFADMQQEIPGCFVFLGNGDSHGLHHPEYVFNDEAIKYGMDFFVQMVETRLAK